MIATLPASSCVSPTITNMPAVAYSAGRDFGRWPSTMRIDRKRVSAAKIGTSPVLSPTCGCHSVVHATPPNTAAAASHATPAESLYPVRWQWPRRPSVIMTTARPFAVSQCASGLGNDADARLETHCAVDAMNASDQLSA